jgi:hypothetical protein
MAEKKKKHIRVTVDDIENGVAGSFDQCPITHAVRRVWRTQRPIAVRHEGVFVGALDEPELWIAELPRVAERFISRFDDGKKVAPLEFDLIFE